MSHGIYETASSDIWQEISMIVSIQPKMIDITVKDRKSFLSTLRKNGYTVNNPILDNPLWSAHPFDSARTPSKTDFETELHFANDNANDPRKGPNYFYAHWDAAPVNFDCGCGPDRPSKVIINGLKHLKRDGSGIASPKQVKEDLKREGKYKGPVR